MVAVTFNKLTYMGKVFWYTMYVAARSIMTFASHVINERDLSLIYNPCLSLNQLNRASSVDSALN